MSDLPYRRNVGAVLFNRAGQVLIARRADVAADAWQLPQGGLDEGEDPAAAVLRELGEEIGTAEARILGEVEDWLTYDLPAELIGKALRGKYRGQKQRWFALGFTGADSAIRLDLDPHPEFNAWRWTDLEELPGIVVAFRKPIYERLVVEFEKYKGWAA
ncbi:RNA pyrophosphohydrolase [Pseudoroseomonas deserti]|uniref:RNA pyrophosphohydrolase n=1 Tax=Teichococcus deserti TaxID=1817963 RepID=A0A1V2GWC3_9PROT|nr:RNA pyrophosphohydrolase [Pseudoroseomonas deserti]ONG47425.1 RNA pyrophosphohydrolase [Pseudoroseomonas deserti]